ncbi:glycosyl hydrolase, partial [Pontiella sp.]|uniref:glycosyl hydrolase n=1 Tax=Pontiella sp. TaxID=2837462 RepID=UPI003562E629
VDNISVVAYPGSVFAHDGHFNLAKYQETLGDSSNSTTPRQYGNDGIVAQDSRWTGDDSGEHTYKVTLATPMTIGSAHLYSGGTWDAAMADIQLQYSDGSSWIDIPGASFSGNTSKELNITFDSPITAQQFRLYTTDATARVKELALYPPTADGSMVPFGADVDLNIAKLRQYDYSSVAGANYPKLAIDGYVDDSSGWASANSAGPHDLEIHLQQGEKIGGIQLYSGYEGQPGTQIQNFEVAYDSGGSWVVFDGGAIAGNAELNRNIHFNAAATTTKIRFRSLDAGQAFVRELVVLPDNGGAGYPLWTDAQDEAPPSQSFLDYEDSYYTIENRSNGQNLSTAASGSFTTTDEPWFQVLLNLDTDTYRLRSKDSDACFEVANASVAAGAAVVEGTYSGMPHQRWRLEDAGDGTHFQIVNVWSGLVLDLDGTNVVQAVADADQTQHWAINYQTHYPKQGQAAFPHFNFMYKSSWNYNWSYGDDDLFAYGQYMPMQWGNMASSTAGILRSQPTWYGRANQTTVLGFNEPDGEKQANMTEETAAYQWPRLERMRLPLAGPVPAQHNGSWRQTYEAMAEEQGLRCEYMALHWYSGGNGGSPQNIINVVNSLYSTYGKPVWITEFAVKDWSGSGTWSRNDNFNWLAEFLWRAEGIAHLKKYSIFEWGTEDNNDDPTVGDGPTMGLHNSNDKSDPGYEDLSELGLMVAGWDGDATVRDEKAYIIHNKGRSLRLIDDPENPTVTHANILNRSTTEQFMLVSAGGNKKYIVGLSSGRRLYADGTGVGLAERGTTGTAVEWELEENQYGWYFINHPSSSKRLCITTGNAIGVYNDGNTGETYQFRFIPPAQPISLAEVQSLPYAESFEDGFGAWLQSYDDDYDWTRNSGGTPSAAAGPSGASDGDWYLYAEGHDSGAANESTWVDCAFDLSNVANVELTFDYHMYGNYIDFLAVDVFDGSAWTTNVWVLYGKQHASSEAPWSSAAVDLSPYTGSAKAKIRFRTKRTEWSSADPAIDNIRLEEVPQTLPYAESFESGFGVWKQSTGDDLDWTRNSGGTDTGNTGPDGASDGSWYLYVENHDSGVQYKTASLECLFDFSAVAGAELLFDYHMYGDYIDYLSIDVYDGATWSSNVWQQVGEAHASGADPWSTAAVDLSAFAGNGAVTIRFRSKQQQWHAADTAIDNIRLLESESPYNQWAAVAFSNAPAGTDQSETGNPDGDSNLNTVEWILATDPLVADSPVKALDAGTANFVMTYTRRIVSGIAVRAAWSPSLSEPDWGTAGLTESVIGTVDGVETVEASVPIDADEKHLRIEIE